MLRVDLRALRDGPVVVAEDAPADSSLWEGLDFRIDGPVHVAGRIGEAGEGQYFFQGEASARVAAECRRCLEPVSLEVHAPLSLLFSDDVAPDESIYRYDPRSGYVDLGEAVREELILAVPEFVLCREDCRGLCPGCGINLNESECTCGKAPDPRWAGLEQLKDKLDH